MTRILMILALCLTATAPRADTQLTPFAFDLHKQFDDCISTPSENLYRKCQDVLTASYTLRREIAYALDECQTANVEGCVTAFKDAGFPADRLNIATLERCEMLGRLEEVDIREVPENSCIEKIARNIERNSIPTSHNTDISCGINYIECAEIIDKGREYWESAAHTAFYEKLNAVPGSSDFSNDALTSHRYYSLLERQHRLRIDLAETTCNIQTVIPHWANTIDNEECMGEAYARIWLNMNAEEE
ncbi:hypothetical protein [Profundibacter amoris]|uniref:DUF1311 domain-containing protein n=1 Tax=Profundibacter amoris TaxID=2171755 RepID=A0A347UDX4_9RHOB|nr:hypothetical protein [Profundibacter amoris]AXX97052.1 hypothetical protein BAR1_03375 [Profundibacter amoris]